MKIQVLYFAQLKEALGKSSEQLEVRDDSTLGDLLKQVTARGELKRWKDLPMRYAINEELADVDKGLKEGDVIALLPPVAGG